MTAQSQVIVSAVNNNMCAWNSLSTHKYASDIFTMSLDNEGFLVPELIGTYDNDAACTSVCPFSPVPLEPVKDKTALTEIFLTKAT